MKTCSHCHRSKAPHEFYADTSKASGLSSRCKVCAKFKSKAGRNNRDKRDRTYHGRPCRRCGGTEKLTANRSCVECVRVRDRERARDAMKRAYHKGWSERNRDKVRANNKEYRLRHIGEPWFKAAHTLRGMLWRSLTEGRSLARLPYTVDQLVLRIECQFKPGMSWANYGAWEIDHKIPVRRFTERGETRAHVINALCNLQPLWLSENRSKGAKTVWGQSESRSQANLYRSSPLSAGLFSTDVCTVGEGAGKAELPQ